MRRKVGTPHKQKLKIRNKLIKPTLIKSRDILSEKCNLNSSFIYFQRQI